MIFFFTSKGKPVGQGHVGFVAVVDPIHMQLVFEAQADGDELAHACGILGRPVPTEECLRFSAMRQ